MKPSILPRILALVLACAAPAFAADGHDHAGHSHAAKITGPNKGRVLTELEPHAEFFVTAERKVRLTFVDDAGKPVAIPAGFTATLVTGDRADLAVRQKDWFDNAVPAGNSSLLHGFAGLLALSGEPGWAEELVELARAYGGVSRNVPHGAAHALAALTRQAIGIATLAPPSGADLEALRVALCGDERTAPHARPFRPVFLRPAGASPRYQLCVGTTCLPPLSTPAEVAEHL